MSDPPGFAKSKEMFRNAGIDMLFVQNITIGGGEGLFNTIKDTEVPIILSAGRSRFFSMNPILP